MENSLHNRKAACLLALIIALTAALSIVLRIVLSVAEGEAIGEVIWSLLRFFTILTNLLVAIVFCRVGVGRDVSAPILLAVTAAIFGVGLIYHALLAHLNPQTGWGLIADHGVHTAVPALCVIWFILFVKGNSLKARHALAATAWPMLYCIYALVRGAIDGLYPYPFIDANTLSAGQMALNIAGLTACFAVLGGALLLAIKAFEALRARP